MGKHLTVLRDKLTRYKNNLKKGFKNFIEDKEG